MGSTRYIKNILAVLVFIVSLICIFFTHSLVEAQWHVETVDSSGDVGGCTSLALDGSGNPHISYLDSTNGDLKYAYYDGSWHTETVDDNGVVGGFGLGHYTSLALDSSGNPHISYYDMDNGTLKYAYYDGSVWHAGAVNSAGDGGWWCSLALDSSGNPHISYTSGGNLLYTHFDGSWDIEIVDGIIENMGHCTSLALDGSDNPHISYYDDTNGTLKYAYHDGSWHVETVDGIVEDVGVHPSLALDSNGNPHISYSDNTNDDLKYAYHDGSWHVETVDGTIAGLAVGHWTSLALDSSANPHISYQDDTNGDLKYAVLIPTTTTTTTTVLTTTTTTTTDLCPSEALYGEDSDEVKLLRSLRDESLSKTPEGQEIIRLYYELSPMIVQMMNEDEEFKAQVKEMIDGILPLLRGEGE